HWYSPEFVVSILILAALIWLALRRGSKDLLLTSGLAAVLVSPLMAYAFIPLADVVLEHRAYISGLAIALLSAALFRWCARNYKSLQIALPAVILVVLAVMTIQRNTVFANDVSLWEDAASKSPDKARSRFNLGAAYQNAGRVDDAIREYRAALALKPDI